jgi:hypothetical protein
MVVHLPGNEPQLSSLYPITLLNVTANYPSLAPLLKFIYASTQISDAFAFISFTFSFTHFLKVKLLSHFGHIYLYVFG